MEIPDGFCAPDLKEEVGTDWLSLHDEGFSDPILVWEPVHPDEVGRLICNSNRMGYAKPDNLFNKGNNENKNT